MMKEILNLITVNGKPKVSTLGTSEKYTLIEIKKIKIFLYEDGEINLQGTSSKGGKIVDNRYELADFENIGKLQTKVLNDIKKAIA